MNLSSSFQQRRKENFLSPGTKNERQIKIKKVSKMDKTTSNDAKRKSVVNRNLKSRIDKSKNEEKGFVLVVGLIVMMVLLLLTVPFLYQLSFENRLTNKSYKSSAALSLAEAGVERAIWELNYGDISSWTGDDTLRTMGISSFQAAGGNVIGDQDSEIRVRWISSF
jgi:competence protein ComGC